MNKKISFLLFILTPFLLLAQQPSHIEKKAYISLKYYKKKYKKPLTKNDSLNFKYRDGDTLVLLKDYKRPKGKKVPYEFKDSIFLSHYKKLAFNHKNDSLSSETTMKYWKENINIFFSKSIKNKTKKDFLSFTRYISNQVDSLSIKEVKKIEDSNYIIYYKGDFEYESRLHSYKNTEYYLYWNNNNQIYKCSLRIDADKNFNEKLRLYTMKDFFFRTLGYFKQSEDYECVNYFSNCYSDNKHLTEFDMAMLKYHYSYGICKGTSLETFEKQHYRAKKTLQDHHTKMYFFHRD